MAKFLSSLLLRAMEHPKTSTGALVAMGSGWLIFERGVSGVLAWAAWAVFIASLLWLVANVPDAGKVAPKDVEREVRNLARKVESAAEAAEKGQGDA